MKLSLGLLTFFFLLSILSHSKVILIQGDSIEEESPLQELNRELRIQTIQNPRVVHKTTAAEAGSELNSQREAAIRTSLLNTLNTERKKLSLQDLSIDREAQNYFSLWEKSYSQYVTVGYLLQVVGYASGKLVELEKIGQNQAAQYIVAACPECVTNPSLREIGFYIRRDTEKLNIKFVINNVQTTRRLIQVTYSVDQLIQMSGVSVSDSDSITAENQEEEVTSNTDSQTVPVGPSIEEPEPQQTVHVETEGSSTNQPSPTPRTSTRPISTLTLQTISNSEYNGLILEHDIPLNFIEGETFQIRGRLPSAASTGGTFVNLILRNEATGNRQNFSVFVKAGSTQFSLSVDLSVPTGRYFITLFPGFSGTTSRNVYTVEPRSTDANKATNSPAPSTPTNFQIDIIDNKLTLSWNEDRNTPVERVVFTQGSRRKEYILTNFHNSFEVPNKDFAQWQQTTTTVTLASAYSTTQSLSGRTSPYSAAASIQFTATTHHFAQDDPSGINYAEMPWRVNVGGSVTVRGQALTALQNRIITEEPTKSFGTFYFNPSNPRASIAAGTQLSTSVTFNSPGVYIFEVNNMGGGAVINRPVYVGNSYPLLPDFVDLTPPIFDLQSVSSTQPTDPSTQRSILLSLVNQKRREWGLDSVTPNSDLDRLGQVHSQDMIDSNFFGHVNRQGESPGDRARRLGISGSIGENIALNINMTEAHYRLARSPIHLENMVKDTWERVGFGVARDSRQYFYVTQIFSGRDLESNPLSGNELATYKGDVLEYIFNTYPGVTSENQALSSALSSWHNLSEQQKAATPLQTHLRNQGILRYALGNIRLSYNPDFLEVLAGSSYLSPPEGQSFTQAGLSLALVDGGLMEIYVGYT